MYNSKKHHTFLYFVFLKILMLINNLNLSKQTVHDSCIINYFSYNFKVRQDPLIRNAIRGKFCGNDRTIMAEDHNRPQSRCMPITREVTFRKYLNELTSFTQRSLMGNSLLLSYLISATATS